MKMRTLKPSRTVQQLFPGEKSSEPIYTLITEGPYPLRVRRDDPIFSAFMDLLTGSNPLFSGRAGGGKSVRLEAVVKRANIPIFQKILGLEGLEIKIVSVEVDLIPVLANRELSLKIGMKNATSYEKEAEIAEFIIKHGHKSSEDFMEEHRANTRALQNKKGQIIIKVLKTDDFTRTQHRSIQNSILKYIESSRHYFPWRDIDDRVRFMNLQCVASTNASIDRSKNSGYLGDMGIDMAMASRFFFYHIADDNWSEILKAENDEIFHDFIDKLTRFAMRIKNEVSEGSFQAVGEISLRQLRRILHQHIIGGLSEIDGIKKLLSAIPRDSDEYLKGELIVQEHLGLGPSSRRITF